MNFSSTTNVTFRLFETHPKQNLVGLPHTREILNSIYSERIIRRRHGTDVKSIKGRQDGN